MRSIRTWAAWLLIVGIAGGCGRSPVVRYHAMRPLPTTAASASCDAIAIGVGPLELARYLDRPEIVRRSDGTLLEYDSRHRWAEDLETEILRVLGRNLATLLGSERVVVYPSSPPFAIRYRITLNVEQLDVGPEGDLLLRARWIVRRPGAAEPAIVELSEIRREDAPPKAGPLVEAYGEVLAELSRRMARSLCELEAGVDEPGENRDVPPDSPQRKG